MESNAKFKEKDKKLQDEDFNNANFNGIFYIFTKFLFIIFIIFIFHR